MTEREVASKYKGSLLGLAWTIITPLAMLLIYTFVFSQIFKARWEGIEQDAPLVFAVNIFAGLIVFNFFSECITKAPFLVIANPNYVKKVVFPLEVLGATTVASATFSALISLGILIVFQWLSFHRIPLTLIWLPLVFAPLILGSLACTWLLSAAGVFVRDISQITGVVLNMTMFITPIFFPASALPGTWGSFLKLNPLTQIIEQTRRIAVMGANPDIGRIALGIVIGTIACELSYRIFIKSKGAFGDVL